MRILCIAGVVLSLLSFTGAAYAALDFSLWTLVGHNANGAVNPGDSIDLLVQMDTDAQITAVVLDIVMPMEGWTRNWHEFSAYSWFEDDGVNDHSEPAGATTSRVINNNTWLDDGIPQFKFDTSYNPLSSWATGAGVDFAAFRLTIPTGTTPGLYNIGIRNASALDWDVINHPDEYTAPGSDFSLRVNGSGAIPEPGTLALGLVGLAGLVALRRWRA